jgi:hypothetical protein
MRRALLVLLCAAYAAAAVELIAFASCPTSTCDHKCATELVPATGCLFNFALTCTSRQQITYAVSTSTTNCTKQKYETARCGQCLKQTHAPDGVYMMFTGCGGSAPVFQSGCDGECYRCASATPLMTKTRDDVLGCHLNANRTAPAVYVESTIQQPTSDVVYRTFDGRDCTGNATVTTYTNATCGRAVPSMQDPAPFVKLTCVSL